jgi:universal stress protein A
LDNAGWAIRLFRREIHSKKGTLKMKETIEVSMSPQESPSKASKVDYSFDRILVATDFAPNTERAIKFAVELGKRIGAQVTFLHVVPEPSALDYPMEGIPPEEIGKWKELAKEKLAEEVATAQLDYPNVDSIQRYAISPKDEIVKVAAELPASMLVVSTHGLTGWKHFLLGSYAEKILEHAPCPTVIVK